MASYKEGNFKKKHTLQTRKNESNRILAKYTNRIPIIVEQGRSQNIPSLDKQKYLVPMDLTVGQFCYVIRKRINLKPQYALYVFFNETLAATESLLSSIYERKKDEDGFLYCVVNGESTFG